jgi:murein DD-endopeptidase MepM/ murein hydrolase activator NlpD
MQEKLKVRKAGYALLLIALSLVRVSVFAALEESFDVIVAKKDTLNSIFRRYGLKRNDLYKMLSEVDSRALTDIKPGQLIHFRLSQKKLHEMRIIHSHKNSTRVNLSNGQYKITEKKSPDTGYYRPVKFNIKKSLYLDGKKFGLSVANILEIDKVMAGDTSIDPRKLRGGAEVKVILEGGSKEGVKKVVAIEIISGKTHWAVTRFNNRYGNSFYHNDGSTAEVSFLKYPLKDFRVSSPFSTSRYHPIHHYRRPHNGVDLAAAKGTPVWATAQGKVEFVGTKGGYGKTVILKHGNQYQTVYAHLSGYKKGLRIGDVVNQKQVIAYVGNTGHATGPHLHYEWRKKGVPYDPMRVKLPKKAVLTGSTLQAFEQYRMHIKQAVVV